MQKRSYGVLAGALLAASIALLAACTTVRPAPQSAAASADRSAERSEIGHAVYRANCARCHDTGRRGAPVADRPADWAKRSRLWQAVLADHVRQGWFAMPARGGNRDLSDADVQAAAEYLLARAHRREPQD